MGIDKIFMDCTIAPKEILECLAMLAERNSLAAINRIKGIKEETVMDWLRKASHHVERSRRY
jgi:transposase-like protein